MHFRHYDSLRVFVTIVRCGSLTEAAERLNLSKGAVSYHLRRLEEALGFTLLHRSARGIATTPKGDALWLSAQRAFQSIETDLARLAKDPSRSITIGLTTYFASRWLSPRLMSFLEAHSDVRIMLQPMIDLLDVRREPAEILIRWGKGDWDDLIIEPLLPCPAYLTGAPAAKALIEKVGLEKALEQLTHLNDREGSVAWQDWYRHAGLDYHAPPDTLVIPDPNVRVQALCDGQGIALNDRLVAREEEQGLLVRLSEHEMIDYGYFLAYAPGALEDSELRAFRDWILEVASLMPPTVSGPTGSEA